MIADELDRNLMGLYAMLQLREPVYFITEGHLFAPPGSPLIVSAPVNRMIGLVPVHMPIRQNQMSQIYDGFCSISSAISKLEARKRVARPGSAPPARRPGATLPNERIADKLDQHLTQLKVFLAMPVPAIPVSGTTVVHMPLIDMQLEAISRAVRQVAKAIRKLEDRAF